MNLLVHMDARGTLFVYPHLGHKATYLVGEMENAARQRAMVALAIGRHICLGECGSARKSPKGVRKWPKEDSGLGGIPRPALKPDASRRLRRHPSISMLGVSRGWPRRPRTSAEVAYCCVRLGSTPPCGPPLDL